MIALTDREEILFQTMCKDTNVMSAAVLLTSDDYISLLKKELKKDVDVAKVLQELDYFSVLDSFVLYDEGWIETKIEDGSEGVYVGVYFCTFLNGKKYHKRLATVKTLNEGLQAYKQMGILAGAIISMGNELLMKYYTETVNLLEIERIERLVKKGITREDIQREIKRRQENELATKEEMLKLDDRFSKIYSTRVLFHLFQLWPLLSRLKNLLGCIETLSEEDNNCDRWAFVGKEYFK